MLQGKRVVVTGGAGFLGSHLVERLAPRNEVVVLDDMSVGKLGNLAQVRSRVEVVKGSVLDTRALKKALDDADIVFHLAALTSVPESVERPLPYAEANVMGTVDVLVEARDAGADRVVFASTCAIYGRAMGPLIENLPPDPVSPYAVTKLACEYFCRSMSQQNGVETVSLRLFNVFGPRQSANSPYASVVAKFVQAKTMKRPLRVFGDGKQTRDFIYAGDVAEAFERAATAKVPAGAVFNVGSGRETSIHGLIEALESIGGHRLEVTYSPARSGDIRRSVADTKLARQVLGFEAKTSLRDGLRLTLSHVPQAR